MAYDARRRNRNIGTAKSGHGQSNKLTIPSRWTEDRVFYEVLEGPVVVSREVHGRTVTFLVEPTRSDCFHACTLDDVVERLRMIPLEPQRDVSLFLLRQPTRKQQILSPVWGRLSYWSNLGRYAGTAVFLEAQPVGLELRWSKSLSPERRRELERLEDDGHSIEATKRDYVISSTPEAIRSTQLYRTLSHEIGHNAHYLEVVEDRITASRTRDELEAEYDEIPTDEREKYAHRFADSEKAAAMERGWIPFPRRVLRDQMRLDGLSADWFS